jgi:hypothetical protein
MFLTKEDSCKPSWEGGGGWGACLHEEIYQDGNLSWQDQQAASWILITSEKTAWMYVQPSPSDMLVNAANECCNSSVATANDDGVS